MKVSHIACGPTVNESEEKAISLLRENLSTIPSDEEWILLSNLTFSINHQLQSDEIDIVVIGPPGVKVLEVKHWNSQWMESNQKILEHEAERIMGKARKVGTTLRRRYPKLPHVDGAFFITSEAIDVQKIKNLIVRGIAFYSLNDWKTAIGLSEIKHFSKDQVRALAKILEPKSIVALDGSLRRFANLVNLELLTKKEERFHRIYRGIHSIRQDRVILHLYDLSAYQDKKPKKKASREFEALLNLQLYPWAPRIIDSFQSAPGYLEEMFFFTIADPAAPTLSDRSNDSNWSIDERIDFARKVIDAPSQMHASKKGEPIIHRNLNPKTILISHNGAPIFTGFDFARIPFDSSVGSTLPLIDRVQTAAPEVRKSGLSAADQRSDVYSICSSLLILFESDNSHKSLKAIEILKNGLTESPEERNTLEQLGQSFKELVDKPVPPQKPTASRFWSEGHIVRFREHDYRIITKLGVGGIGATFKVIEIDPSNKDELGTFVAKTAHSKEAGERVLKGNKLARSHLGRHPGLSAIYEVGNQWKENDFLALLAWIEGVPLADFKGVFPLLAEDQQEPSPDALAIRWLKDLCESMDILHRNGIIHGDVSPKNILVSSGGMVLTDYDFVTKIGTPFSAPGTILFCSPSYLNGLPAQPSDDIYALAASFFHVIFDKEPFLYGGDRVKNRGLNWEGINRDDYPVLLSFLNKATNQDPAQRFQSAKEAIAALQITPDQKVKEVTLSVQPPLTEPTWKQGSLDIHTESREVSEGQIDWLTSILQSYPGSRWGNCETRGLDTPFAEQTYVETGMEQALIRDIRERRTRLVILCGNAGDGKTALLQNMAQQMGFGVHKSADRIIEHRLPDGPMVRMNLDGSAAWRGRSANQILDKFLEPFQQGPPEQDIAHLLAINDGPLLEWIETVESRENGNSTPLTKKIISLLQEDDDNLDSHIRFISLNQRSLVGGINEDCRELNSGFLDHLLDRLYGGGQAKEIWKPCLTCSAQSRCEVFRALKVFGPDSISLNEPKEIRRRARQRLFEALQAVHLRGEVHITSRELRAALVYVLFGLHLCEDYHGSVVEPKPLPYWDLAFNPTAPGRQGEVLHELSRFDPALEAHPKIDRYLQRKPGLDDSRTAPHYELPLFSARRRAYFEWTKEHIKEVAHDEEALGLSRGRHMMLFRLLGMENEEMNEYKRKEVCKNLCRGISRLEDLPPQALDRPNIVPLRITPRTPTETAFWVEKSLSNFRIHVDLPSAVEGLDRLHRQVFLIYQYRDGGDERLRLGAELFHLLLELSEGYQLGDISNDDSFTHLSIFVQRLAHENECEIMAWNPMKDEKIYRITTHIEQKDEVFLQKLVLSPLAEGELS